MLSAQQPCSHQVMASQQQQQQQQQHTQQPRKNNRNKSHRGVAKTAPGNNHSSAKNLEQSQQMESTLLLDKTLHELGCYEEGNQTRRLIALDTLEKILCRWALAVRNLDVDSNQCSVVIPKVAMKSSDISNTSNHMNSNNANSSSGNASTAAENRSGVGNNNDIIVNQWQRPRVALVSFGSYRLGVHGPSSDLDVLALAPPTCTRGDFFTSLVRILRSDERISDVHPIPTAYTPVIKFVLNTVQIDLVFGRVNNPTKLLQYQQKKPSQFLSYEHASEGNHSGSKGGSNNNSVQQVTSDKTNANERNSASRNEGDSTKHATQQRIEYNVDDSDLVGLDEAGVRSLNGVRVSQKILSMVPNVDHFRLTLRAIKAWATVHGIHSNVLGFLGGVNWAILVAWVCIQHPHAYPPKLIKFFFRAFSTWKWPTPVTLGPPLTQPPLGVTRLPAWNPVVNPRDGLHFMPIITPAYPSMNSSYNVGLPQMRRIQEEMIRSSYILENNSNRRMEGGNKRNVWQQLLGECDFFERHSNFIQINIRAINGEDFLEWFRLCESRLRLLIASLETPDVVHAWPHGKFFDRRYNKNGVCKGSGESEKDCMHESCFFIALRFAPHVETVDLRYSMSDFLHIVNSWDGRKPGMDLSIARIIRSELPSFVFDYGKKNNNRRKDWNGANEKQQNNQENNKVTNEKGKKNKNFNNSYNKNRSKPRNKNKNNIDQDNLVLNPSAIQKMTIEQNNGPENMPGNPLVESPTKRARKFNSS